MINDMFRFGRIEELDYVREKLSVTSTSKPNTASLHLRFSGLPADDHSTPLLNDSYYEKCFSMIPDDVEVYVFSDDNSKAETKLLWFRKIFPQNFSLVKVDAFLSLNTNAILGSFSKGSEPLPVSTYVFWISILYFFIISFEILFKIKFANFFKLPVGI